jgi:hypothetical protein
MTEAHKVAGLDQTGVHTLLDQLAGPAPVKEFIINQTPERKPLRSIPQEFNP